MKVFGIRSIVVVVGWAALSIAMPAPAQSIRCPQAASLVKLAPVRIDGATPYIYKTVNGIGLRLHVFTPQRRHTGRLPALVIFGGGGWMFDDLANSVPQATYFASRGLLTILPDYRVFCRDGVDITAEISDAKSAMRWVRGHARELGIDHSRIAAAGASSGGHLALSTVFFSNFDDHRDNKTISATPNALVLFFPCVDPTTEVERQYSTPALGNHGEDVSPARHLMKGLPPTIILQGTADPLYDNVKKFAAAAADMKNSVEFFIYEGAPHGFMNASFNDSKWRRDALSQADRFLTKHGYLPSLSPSIR